MSEPKKIIEIEKSSLLSLKAEVLKLKKQTEELKNKEHKPSKIIKKKSVNNVDNNKSDTKVIEIDDSSELERSKRILEAKAKYYDRMTKNKINSTLVLFGNKKDDEIRKDQSDSFIEFTDCFGRTRKVEKTEFEKIKQDNQDIIQEDVIQEPKNQNVIENELGDNFLKQREEWRKQEEINKERNEVYYQDILFDEARLHGTAWYKFSLDHEERKTQQENLIKMREKTEQAQSQRAELKKHRDDIIKNRIKLAKERIRNKLGLPVEQTDNDDKISDDNKVDDRQETAREQSEKDAEKELQRERERKRHIRPWDKNKLLNKEHSDESDEDRWTPKKEKMIMSQDEWIEKQRIKRVNEFAPSYDQPSTSSYNKRNNNSMNLEQSVAANLRYIREKFDVKK